MTSSLEIKYSQLFLKFAPRNFVLVKEDNPLHPFYFLEDLCHEESHRTIKFRDFNEGFAFYNELKTKGEHCIKWFTYEYSLIKGSNEYLNKIVGTLIKLYKRTNSIKKELDYYAQYRKKYYNIIQVIIKQILETLFVSYHLDLNKSNRIYLSNWYYLNEPINSFKFTKYPEDKRLKELYDKYLKTSFIDYDTAFSTFKALFENRTLVNKINWVDQKTTLYFFIKLLRQHKVIKNTKNKHWLITAEFFLLKGETLIPKDFLNQKEPQTKEKREKLEKFVLALKI